MDKLKIENHEELVRDTKTQAVLNTDLSSLQAYKKRREIQRQKDAELQEIKEEMSEIKGLLHQLLAEKSK
jgi:hypothetical protein